MSTPMIKAFEKEVHVLHLKPVSKSRAVHLTERDLTYEREDGCQHISIFVYP